MYKDNKRTTITPESPFEKALGKLSPYAIVNPKKDTVTEAYDMSELPPNIRSAIGLFRNNQISVLECPNGKLPQELKALEYIEPATRSNGPGSATYKYGIHDLFPHNGIEAISVKSELFGSGTLYVTRRKS